MKPRVSAGISAVGCIFSRSRQVAESTTDAPRAIGRALVVLASLAPVSGAAQTWVVEPAIGLEETATNNVAVIGVTGALTESQGKQSDFVTRITPSLRINEKGAQTSLAGSISVPILLYARTGADNNSAFPLVDLTGDAAVIDRWLHVEGSVNVSEQFFNPFGPQPVSPVNVTANRYLSENYRVSPYAKGTTSNDIDYELRNNDVWTNLAGTQGNPVPTGAQNSFYSEFLGNASKSREKLGWQANFDYTDVRFTDNPDTIRTGIARLGPLYAIDPQLRISADVGYESNEYTLTSSHGATYGAGFEWRPTNRATMKGIWEHRFFGSSYTFSFDNRTPLSVVSLQASRNITTYPQQIATLASGVDVTTLVNSLFLSTITDPAARQQAVQQFISQYGLPAELQSPLSLYTQQIQLEQSESATLGLLGARNSILLTAYYAKNEPITASGTPIASIAPALTIGTNNQQTGGTIVWTHQLSPSLLLTGTVNAVRTVSNTAEAQTTNQGTAYLNLSTPLSPLTTVYAAARYQLYRSDVAPGYTEVAGIVGITHTFK